MSLRRKEGLENLVRLLRRQTHSGVADRHYNFLVFCSLRLNQQLSLPIHILHRLDTVDHQVHKHLLQLHAICHYVGKIRSQLRANQYFVSGRLAAQQHDHLSNHFIYAHQLSLCSALLEEEASSADDLCRARCIFDDSSRSLACLCNIGLIARKPPQTRIGIGDRRGNRLIHFVRQRGGQFSQRGHSGDPRQVPLRIA